MDPLRAEQGVRATALIFIRTDCPVANQAAPEIERVRALYADRGVRFWLVYVDPQEPADRIQAHGREYGLRAPAIRDPDHALVRRAGVHVTPEAAVYVFDGDQPRLTYRGRIDDRVVELGRQRPRATRFDLRDALESDARPQGARTGRHAGGRLRDRGPEIAESLQMHRAAVLVVLALGAAGGLGRSLGTSSLQTAGAAEPVTFTRDVAPIVFTHCAPCHHDGGAGPFPLLSYADVRRRARQIVKVTGARVMPPWPPVEGHGTFKGERRLDPAQIATLARWVEHGAVEGAGADLPAAPVFAAGWPLGTPDLVLTPDRAWTLPAEGGDVFRNFVLPVPLTATAIRARDRDPSGQRPHPPSRQRASGSQRRGPPA